MSLNVYIFVLFGISKDTNIFFQLATEAISKGMERFVYLYIFKSIYRFTQNMSTLNF
jgi:hypothetical protein